MNLKQYQSKRGLYSDFSNEIKIILETALKTSSLNYHLFQVQCRAKEIDKLEEKLKRPEYTNENQEKIEDFIKDLAGCRIIFYQNNDITLFRYSEILRRHFLVQENKSHYPIPGGPKYLGDHYVVTLLETHPKAEHYKNLQCEIQVQNIFCHGWSEITHEILYKNEGFETFGNNEFKKIESEFNNVVTDFLIPAIHKLQNLSNDYENLKLGKDIYENNMINGALDPIGNQERFVILERFKNHVLPNYINKELKSNASTIIATLKEIMLVSKNSPPGIIVTSNGSYPGKSYDDVLNVCIEILISLSPLDPKFIFSILIDFYISEKDKKNSKKFIKAVESFTKYNIDVIQQMGFFFQNLVILTINDWESGTLLTCKELVLAICKEIFQTTCTAYKMTTYNRASVIDMSLPILPEYSKNRKTCIDILVKLYNLSSSISEKKTILSTLNASTVISNTITPSNELYLIVLDDEINVINFCTSLIASEKYEILLEIESMVYWLSHHYGQLDSEKFNNSVGKKSQKLDEVAFKFYNSLHQNKNYVIYKTLVSSRLSKLSSVNFQTF